tara:strand:+ start:3235 stop:3381 length:147 start_codon:yes stop_codon:yes gene_type:complete
MDKKAIITKLNLLIEDFNMLDSGTWIPDKDSIEASIGNLEEVKKLVNE